MRLKKAPWRTVALALATSTLALGTPVAALALDEASPSADSAGVAAAPADAADGSAATQDQTDATTPGDATGDQSGDTTTPGDDFPAAPDAPAAASLDGVEYEAVQAAIDAAQSGDTVTVLGASSPNTEALVIRDKAIVITTDAQSPAMLAGTLTLENADGTTVSNLRFERRGSAGDTASADFASLVLNDSSNVRVQGCSFTFTGGGATAEGVYTPFASNAEDRVGIRVSGDTDDASISGTSFTMDALSAADSPDGTAHTWRGIEVLGSAQTVENLHISSCGLTVTSSQNPVASATTRFGYRLVDVAGDAAKGGEQGVSGLVIDGMSVANAAGIEAASSNIVGASITNATGVTVRKIAGAVATIDGEVGVRLGADGARPNGTVTVEGLSFASATGIELIAPSCGALTAQSNTFADGVTPMEGAPVVDEHSRYYYSVSNAASESDGDAVALTEDVTEDVVIPAGAVLDLDLAGHTITSVDGPAISNRGALTLTDSGHTGQVTSPDADHPTLVNEQHGIVALDGGLITRTAAAAGGDASGATAEPVIDNHGDLTVGTGATVMLSDASAALIENNGASTYSPAELVIEGGTYAGGSVVVHNGRAGTAQVNDGYFRTGTAAPFTQASGSPASSYLRVYGGTYTANPIEFVPKTFVAKVNDDLFTVMLKRNLYAGEYIAPEDDAIDESNLADGQKVTLDEETGRFVVSCDGGELCPSNDFFDVDTSQWYHDPVDWAIGQGYMTGYDNTPVPTFGPDDPLSRAQVAAIFYKMAGEPEWDTSALDRYTDCAKDDWYSMAVAWATDMGIFSGDSTKPLFYPHDTITRQEMAIVLWRMQGEPAGTGDLSSFPDGLETSSWAVAAMQWATEAGVFTGNDQTGELMPLDGLTRAQAATVLMRIS